jgi:hypothetical protein
MESLAPPLSSLLHIRWEMENGSSFREALGSFLQVAGTDEFCCQLREWSVRKTHNQSTQSLFVSISSPYRRALLDLFERGWQGEPILESLQELEKEIRDACADELDRFVATLPFRALFPLLALQLPAYLMLLLGPVFSELLHSLGSG